MSETSEQLSLASSSTGLTGSSAHREKDRDSRISDIRTLLTTNRKHQFRTACSAPCPHQARKPDPTAGDDTS